MAPGLRARRSGQGRRAESWIWRGVPDVPQSTDVRALVAACCRGGVAGPLELLTSNIWGAIRKTRKQRMRCHGRCRIALGLECGEVVSGEIELQRVEIGVELFDGGRADE